MVDRFKASEQAARAKLPAPSWGRQGVLMTLASQITGSAATRMALLVSRGADLEGEGSRIRPNGVRPSRPCALPDCSCTAAGGLRAPQSRPITPNSHRRRPQRHRSLTCLLPALRKTTRELPQLSWRRGVLRRRRAPVRVFAFVDRVEPEFALLDSLDAEWLEGHRRTPWLGASEVNEDVERKLSALDVPTGALEKVQECDWLEVKLDDEPGGVRVDQYFNLFAAPLERRVTSMKPTSPKLTALLARVSSLDAIGDASDEDVISRARKPRARAGLCCGCLRCRTGWM